MYILDILFLLTENPIRKVAIEVSFPNIFPTVAKLVFRNCADIFPQLRKKDSHLTAI